MMKDFVQALRDKYIDQEDVSDQIYIPTDRTITTQIELVGFGKISNVQKQLVLLTSLDLSNQKISEAGPIQTLHNNLPRVKILNLTNNHLDWTQLILILKSMPRLEELIVTSNELHQHPDLKYPTPRLSPLLSLVIGRTTLKWNELIKILSSIWTNVVDLDLWDSQLSFDDMRFDSSSDDQVDFVSQICALRLSKNNLPRPNFLNNMGHLECLRELDLSSCHLESFMVNESLAVVLRNVTILNISYNELTLWSDVSTLIKLKSLKSLICHENPFYTSEKMAKPLIIGRINTLTKLNREEISRVIRKDSEIYYLRTILQEYRNFKLGNDAGFLSRHPRFNQLAEIYGLPEATSERCVQDKFLNLDFQYENQVVSRKVLRDMRVSNLRMFARRLFKLSPSTAIRLTCFSSSADGKQLNYDLEEDSQSLSFYLVEKDKKIVVQKID